ncbi:hypothetical protein GQ43DRAFT_444356 [Delitschia confertaspora ATCC 74209]|uniref:Uncharacterized protein n=1 Tax=Delitschia confertaspora ATCC 74209 TaxID=1513339 RepID=A0A9P4MLP1_9PLEO|nr:hypothetical protein GQ43DRAFT_444356 [Delitschia confertaspora ATCC 74209]
MGKLDFCRACPDVYVFLPVISSALMPSGSIMGSNTMCTKVNQRTAHLRRCLETFWCFCVHLCLIKNVYRYKAHGS